ncbi:MAG: hypothetical protein JRN24_01720 [Nitrososphaerota archaeon]|nr:hypothetical protein [Nitrososphaerota archaeon]
MTDWVRVEPVFDYSPSNPAFQVLFELRSSKIGALSEVLAELAKNGLNLTAVDAANQPGKDVAIVSLLLRPSGKSISAADIKRIIDSSPDVISSAIELPEAGLLVEKKMFPIVLTTGQRLMFVRTELISEMLSVVRRQLGTGGDLIVYELGHAAGRNDARNIGKLMGNAAILERARLVVQIRTALGWGKTEFLEYSASPYKTRVKVERSFECEGVKSRSPYSQFLRGHFAGLAAEALGRDVSCLETKCVAAGDQYCEFELEESGAKNPKP